MDGWIDQYYLLVVVLVRVLVVGVALVVGSRVCYIRCTHTTELLLGSRLFCPCVSVPRRRRLRDGSFEIYRYVVDFFNV